MVPRPGNRRVMENRVARMTLTIHGCAGCSVCAEAARLQRELSGPAAAGRPRPTVEHWTSPTDSDLEARYGPRMPVVAIGDRRASLVVSPGQLRALFDRAKPAREARPDGPDPWRGPVRGTHLVPVAVRPARRARVPRPAWRRGRAPAARSGRRCRRSSRRRDGDPRRRRSAPIRHGRTPRRTRAPPRARARCRTHRVRVGFGSSSPSLGRPSTRRDPLRSDLPLLRQFGGVLLIVLGLNLMGVFASASVARSWRPLERLGSRRRACRRHGRRTRLWGRLRGRVDALVDRRVGAS